MTRLFRYGLASVGPVASAGAQFLLSLVLLHALDSRSFGSFSFLLVASQLMVGAWGALFCAPLLVVMTSRQGEGAEVRAIFSANLAFAGVAALAFFGIALALGLSTATAAIFAASVATSLVRAFARAHAYAIGAQVRSMLSDICYATIVLAGVAAMWGLHAGTQSGAFLALFVGGLCGLAPFGTAYFTPQFARFALADVPGYRAIWRQHSGWSLVGVVSTEATMNSQAYLVTLFAGPSAFASIAATSLLIRPIMVALNALMEFERAQMARHIGAGEPARAVQATSLFRWVLLLVWGGAAAGAAMLLAWAPRLIFPPRYSLPVLAIGAASWLAVAFVRVVRAPESALLQAAGEFRALAWASIYACGFSVVSVLVALALFDPLWSVASILTGEIVLALWLWRASRRWERERRTDVVEDAR